MQVKLRLLQGQCAPGSRSLHAKFFLVGRHPECQIRPVDDAVSERHCMLLIGEQNVRVRDLRSLSGTFLNGERVTQDRILASGDQVRVGDTLFAVQVEAPPAALSDLTPDNQPATASLVQPPRFEVLTGEQVEAWLEEADRLALEESRADPSRLELRLPPAPSFPAEVADSPPAKRTPPKRPPGKLPPRPTVVAPSSDAAASQVLEKLHQRPLKTGRAS